MNNTQLTEAIERVEAMHRRSLISKIEMLEKKIELYEQYNSERKNEQFLTREDNIKIIACEQYTNNLKIELLQENNKKLGEAIEQQVKFMKNNF